MTTEENLTQFWMVVKDCLIELYGMPDEAAAKAVRSLWSRKPNGRRVIPSARNLIYHSEPIHIASDLAGDEIPSEALWDGYQRLLKRRGSLQAAMSPRDVAKTEVRKVKPVSVIKRDVRVKAFAAGR
jgi:hypothetical protein